MQISLEEKLAALPESPGVYLHRDEHGKILYIGKATNLRSRVRSYFSKDGGHSPLTRKLARLCADIETIVTHSEKDALILENNLVKMHKPPYNIRLKDDKRYPYLKITLNEEFPALLEVRNPKNDKAAYFGPYANSGKMRQTVSLAKRVFKIRSGALVADKRLSGCPWRDTSQPLDKPCLEFHINRCTAPCVGAVSPENYRLQARELKNFLEGRGSQVLTELQSAMQNAAENMEFEEAAKIRDQIAAVQSVLEKQQVVAQNNDEFDVVGMSVEAGVASMTVMLVRNGKLIGDQHFFLQNIEGRADGEIVSAFLRGLYEGPVSVAREILVPALPDDASAIEEWLGEKAGRKIEIRQPQRGDKVRSLELAKTNATQALREHLSYNATQTQVNQSLLDDLAKHLNLETGPHRIECFEISTIQGSNSVGSMVVATGGKPNKKDYRHFTIKHALEITGGTEPNDFEMMREVLRRRFQRALDNDEKFLPLPDLLLIDGGKGQLGVAVEVLAEKGFSHIPVVGLAKQYELLFAPGRKDPIVIPRNSPALHLLQRIRDEAHRFAITHHRKRRGKDATKSLLDDIPGIGEARRNALLTHFGSLQKIRAASVEEIAAAPGMTKPLAQKLQEYLELLTR